MADTAPEGLSADQQQQVAGNNPPNLPPDPTKTWQQAGLNAIKTAAARPANLSTTSPAPYTGESPMVLTPVERRGLGGVMDAALKWIAGTQGTGVYVDQATGHQYIQHPPLTRGQQWARIGAEAFRGAAAGYAAGKGAGNEGKALQAGIQAQQQASEDQLKKQQDLEQGNYQRERQALLDKADLQMKQLQMTQMIAQTHRLGIQTDADIQENFQKKLEFLKSNGAIAIPGEYDSTDIHEVQKAHPEFLPNHFNYSSIEPIQQPNGKVKFYQLPQDWSTQPVSEKEAAQGWPTYIADQDPNKLGHMEWEPIQPGEYSKGVLSARINSELTKMSAKQKDIVDLQDKARIKTYQEAYSAADQATDPNEKQRYEALGDKLYKDDVRLREASRTPPTIINQGNPAAGSGATEEGPNEAYLQTIPAEYRNQVRSIANGDIPMPPRGKEGMAVRNMVMNYDPKYTDARFKAKQDFKTGEDAKQMVGYATIMEHAENALNHSDAVGFSPLLSHGTTEAGRRYNADMNMFVSELGKLVKGGVVDQAEADRLLHGLDSARAGVRHDTLDEDLKLLSGKVAGVMQKYKTAVGRPLPVNDYFDAKTQQRLQRFGILPAGDTSTAPQTAPMQPKETQTFSGRKWEFQGGDRNNKANWKDIGPA